MMNPNWESDYRATSKKGFTLDFTAKRLSKAYCEFCKQHIPVKNKAAINKGWKCPSCRDKKKETPC